LAWNTFSGGIARGLYGATLFVGSIFVAQFQGVDALGSFGLAVVLGTFAAVIGDCGMSQYLVPMLARTKPDGWGAVLGTVRRFQLVSALPAALLFAILVTVIFSGQDRVVLLAAVPWWLLTRATLSLRSFFAVGENSIWDASAGLAETVLGLALLGAACYSFDSPAWAMLALGVGALVGLVLRVLSLRRLGVVPVKPHRVGLDLVREAWHFNSFNVLVMVHTRIDVVLLSLLGTAAELGIYQAPVRIVTGILLLPEALQILLMARASRIPGDRELHAAQQKMLTIGFVSSLFGVALVALLGDDLLALLYGEPFRAAGLAFTLLAAIVPLRLVAYLNDNQLVSHGLLPVRVYRMGVTAIFAVIGGAIAIALYGYDGAAAVTLASEALLALLYMDAVKRRVGSEFVLYPVGLRRAVA
jgi:O-antigen/teichoic acid export membrane protein